MRGLMIAAVLLALTGPAVAQGVSEAQLKGVARQYTARQLFDLIGMPVCATDPPTGSCTTQDACIDDTNDELYVCIATAWTSVGGGLDETALTGTGRTFTAEQEFGPIKLPGCGTVSCGSGNVGRVCYSTAGAGDGTSANLNVCACIDGATPCGLWGEITLPRVAGLTNNTEIFGDLELGAGAAADVTLTFDLDSNQTIIWDESESAFVASAPIRSAATTSPAVDFYDSDASAGDINAQVGANCTDTGDGSEDCDISIKQQIAGTLTEVLDFDADGGIETSQTLELLGATSGLIQRNSGGTRYRLEIDANGNIVLVEL